jgi:acetyl esterase
MIRLPHDAGLLAPAARAALEVMIALGRPTYESMSPDEARAAVLAGRGAVQPDPPKIRRVIDAEVLTRAGPLSVRIYVGGAADAPATLYFHGGGFVFGDLDTHDTVCRCLALEASATIISASYRKAPEAKFPAAVEDCVDVLAGVPVTLAQAGLHPARLCLAGDSAGGCLAIVAALSARQIGIRISQLALFYPVTDMRMATPSYHRFAEGLPVSKATMRWFSGHYLGSAAAALDWRASPLLAEDLADLPPTYVAVAGFDPLHDEGALFASRAVASGVPVWFDPYPGQIHGFVTMGRIMPEARQAIRNAARWLQNEE